MGASSPAIVSGWHDRPWGHAAPRMRETVGALRPILGGERGSFQGQYIRTRGFRLRNPLPSPSISVAAFGPAMTKVAAEVADKVVLNLVTPAHVAGVRETVDQPRAQRRSRAATDAVWVTVALDPGVASIRQMLNQIAVYFRPPGYGEMLLHSATAAWSPGRAGTPLRSSRPTFPPSCLRRSARSGPHARSPTRSRNTTLPAPITSASYTAEDPGGRAVLRALREATA